MKLLWTSIKLASIFALIGMQTSSVHAQQILEPKRIPYGYSLVHSEDDTLCNAVLDFKNQSLFSGNNRPHIKTLLNEKFRRLKFEDLDIVELKSSEFSSMKLQSGSFAKVGHAGFDALFHIYIEGPPNYVWYSYYMFSKTPEATQLAVDALKGGDVSHISTRADLKIAFSDHIEMEEVPDSVLKSGHGGIWVGDGHYLYTVDKSWDGFRLQRGNLDGSLAWVCQIPKLFARAPDAYSPHHGSIAGVLPKELKTLYSPETLASADRLANHVHHMIGSGCNVYTRRLANEFSKGLVTRLVKPWYGVRKDSPTPADLNYQQLEAFLKLWGYRGLWNKTQYDGYIRERGSLEEGLSRDLQNVFGYSVDEAAYISGNIWEGLIGGAFYVLNYGDHYYESLDALNADIEKGLQAFALETPGQNVDLGGIRPGTLLIIAILDGAPLSVIERMIDYSISDESDLGWLLEYSVKRPDLVRYLIAKGASVNSPSWFGKTPLMVAAQYGAKETVEILLEAGADPMRMTEKKELWECAFRFSRPTLSRSRNALMYALDNGHDEIAAILDKVMDQE